jgi:hypothetical protein
MATILNSQTTEDIREFYRSHSVITSPGKYKVLLEDLPDEITELVRIVQGLIVYDAVASEFYGFKIPEERLTEIHIRPIDKLLDHIFTLDKRPLTTSRPVDKRVAGRCHHFTRLLIAMLRAKGIPARARCGFGTYFNPGYFEDHWLCEYWNSEKDSWTLVDPQFDDVWIKKLNIQHSIMDVPRDQFLAAAEAWRKCRDGDADPDKFGIDFVKLRGLWFVAGSLIRDIASLNKMEMLPWDVWGAQPKPNEQLNKEQLAFFDKLESLTQDPDDRFDDLRKLYELDHRIRVPVKVFNSLLSREEVI